MPDAERAAILKKYRTKVTEQYGAVKFYAMSFTYAGALTAKPTTRGRAAKKR
jgi:hypothetical protein